MIAKSQPLQSQGLAINLKPSRPQKPLSKEESQPSKIYCEDKLFDDDFNFQFYKMLVNQYKSDLLRKTSFRKYNQFPFPPKNIIH